MEVAPEHQRQDHRAVLILGRALHPPWNEGTRVIARNFAQVVGLSHPVGVVSLTGTQFGGQGSPDLSVEQVYSRLPYGIPGDYLALPGIARRIQQLTAQGQYTNAHLFGLPLALAPRLRRKGLRVVVHVTFSQHVYQGQVEQLRAVLGWRLFDPWIDAYACSSPHVADGLARQGYNIEKLVVVPPPIDTQRFQRMDRAVVRDRLGLSQEAFLVVYMGTISPLRFPANDVLRAISLASAHIPAIKLAIFAPVHTHPYNIKWAEENVRQAMQHIIAPVHLQLRDLDEEDKAALYNAADLVLLPFVAPVAVEPPLTLLEAMACESLVAVAPHANRSKVVTDGMNGRIFHSAEHLASCITEIYASDPEQRAAIGQAARMTVTQGYSYPATASTVHRLWSSFEVHNAERPVETGEYKRVG